MKGKRENNTPPPNKFLVEALVIHQLDRLMLIRDASIGGRGRVLL